MKILTVTNEKGGVGKSLIATQFAFYAYFKFGFKVAILDLDQQGNTTKTLGLNPKVKTSSICTSSFLIEGNTNNLALALEEDLKEKSDFVIFPSDETLSAIEKQGDEAHSIYVANFQQNYHLLEKYFDLVIIDTNPNPDIRSTLGLIVATHVISPLQLNSEAIDGIARLVSRLEVLKEINPNLDLNTGFLGMLPNMLEATNFQSQNANNLFKAATSLMFKWDELQIQVTKTPKGINVDRDSLGNTTVIKKTHYAAIKNHSCIAEAQASGTPIFEKENGQVAWTEMKRCFFTMLMKINPERDNKATTTQITVFKRTLDFYGSSGRQIIKNFWMTDAASSLPGVHPRDVQELRDMRKLANIDIVED